MPKVYCHIQEVAFGDIDQAKILYYPRYLHYCHMAMEGFCAAVLGMSYAKFLNEKHHGFPTVHLDVDYAAPIPYGSTMHTDVSLAAIGAKSVVFRYETRLEPKGKIHARALGTTVLVDMRTFSGEELPAWIREPFEAYLDPR